MQLSVFKTYVFGRRLGLFEHVSGEVWGMGLGHAWERSEAWRGFVVSL